MRPAPRILLALAFSALIAGCGGSGVRKQINPPRASIQQLTAQADGQWQLIVRLQNFSNVPTSFESVNAKLVVAGLEAGPITLSPAITIGPESADVVTTTIKPAVTGKLVIASALASGQSVRYSVSGTIVTGDPKGNYSFTFDSTLNPAPGLPGVMR
ncbi:MAG: hypothetical protein WC213_10935 [Arenimonas sp.]|jgi:hypothetical protein